MTEEARSLGRQLLLLHQRQRGQRGLITADDVTDSMISDNVIAYSRLCELAGMPFLTHSVGMFLGEIADWCYDHDWPPLNSLAVTKLSGQPGDGYHDIVAWADDVRQCIAFDGYPETMPN